MKVKKISLSDFRNAQSECVEFSDGVNVLYGKNASGKTNLLEAIYLCAAGKSFRRCDEKNFIAHGHNRSNIFLEYSESGCKDDGDVRTIEITHFSDGKKLKRQTKLDGIKTESASEAVGRFRAVIFTPDNLSIVKGLPEERRRFLDMVMSQASKNYIHCLVMYNKRLKYKNDLLRNAKQSFGKVKVDPIMLESINLTLSEYAVKVVDYRRSFCEKLSEYASGFYNEFSDGKESLEIKYVSQLPDNDGLSFEESVTKVCDIYNSMAESEISSGFTLFGPHRDDISMKLKIHGDKTIPDSEVEITSDLSEQEMSDEISMGYAAKFFGSRGQQRSIVLSLKLAEGEMLKDFTGEYPVFLLDDVFSELDSARRGFILSKLCDRQVIITCCDCDIFGNSFDFSKVFACDGKYSRK